MPKGRKIIPAIGDMIQMNDTVAICMDLLTSSMSDKQVYELLFLKDQSIQYVSLAQLTGIKRATPETMRAYMLGTNGVVPKAKPAKVKKTKVTRRRRTKAAVVTDASA